MPRLLQALVAAASIAVIGLALFVAGGEFRRRSAESVEAEKRQVRLASVGCAAAERQLAAAKAGRPEPHAEPESVLRLVVWDCLGRPADRLPARL